MNSKQATWPERTAGYPENEVVGRDVQAIPAIEKAPWGSHFCQFFATKQDYFDIYVPYYRAGQENNEVCLWLLSEPVTVDEAAEALSRQVDDFERKVAQGQIFIMTFSDKYGAFSGEDGERCAMPSFTPERSLDIVLSGVQDALARGYEGVRQGGNLPLLVGSRWDAQMAFESIVEQGFVGHRVMALCGYQLPCVDSKQLIDVLMRHQYALIKHREWLLVEPSAQKRATAAVAAMNQALTERTTELQAALGDLRGFSQWVTHDLRAPLRHIRSFGDWLAETTVGKLDDDERRTVERIQSSAMQMDTLIVDILAYSTAQQGALHPRPVDLEQLARETWTTLTGGSDACHITLQIRQLPPAFGDWAMLRQVLANLLGNAIKFAGKKPDACVEVGTQAINGEDVYYVRDNGIGFEPAQTDTIFGAFQRLHGKQEYEGTGLGLTITKQIITRHGGRIWAEGSPGIGATFYFTLPGPDAGCPARPDAMKELRVGPRSG